MAREQRRNWIVGVCRTESDGVSLWRVNGTSAMVKKHLAKLVREDRLNDDSFDNGTTDAKDVETVKDGNGEIVGLNAYAAYGDYHIDCSAKPEDAAEPEVL